MSALEGVPSFPGKAHPEHSETGTHAHAQVCRVPQRSSLHLIRMCWLPSLFLGISADKTKFESSWSCPFINYTPLGIFWFGLVLATPLAGSYFPGQGLNLVQSSEGSKYWSLDHQEFPGMTLLMKLNQPPGSDLQFNKLAFIILQHMTYLKKKCGMPFWKRIKGSLFLKSWLILECSEESRS